MAADASTKKQFEVAFKEKNYADQIRLGKQILESSEPDNAAVCIVWVSPVWRQSLVSRRLGVIRKKSRIELIDAVGG